MLRRLEREMKAKAKEGNFQTSTSTAGTTSGGSLPSSPIKETLTQQIPLPPVAPLQVSYQVAQPQQQPQQPPIAHQQPQDPITSEHPHAASLNSGSSGMGSTPTQAYEMPFQVQYPSSDTRRSDRDESMGESTPDADDGIYPARVVDRESKRHSFFRTILNPLENSDPPAAPGEKPKSDAEKARALLPTSRPVVLDPNVQDPIELGLLDENEAKFLFDLVFARLNGFINLFDPKLHTVPYVRARSPFLFSCLIMAGCKFWKAELYRQCQQIAHSFAYKAFAEGWTSIEVIQAFACLVYWKEPDDTRTWTYIGYACRMAVELGLNTYVGKPEGESEEQKRERRNRERTYLVLWVHDRALSMQTGRNWMLPEDDLVRHAKSWHDDSPMRPEDVIVAAMVNLRQIAAETTDVYRMQKGGAVEGHYSDVNHEILLHGCNSKLTSWMDFWDAELKRANGQPFHYSFLGFFRLHVRLFLNSLGMQSTSTPLGRTSPSLQSLSICYTSAMQSLEIVTKQFAPWGLLRYGQDSMTVMSAYSAVFLIKLLRRTAMLSELGGTAFKDIHELISQTADAYEEAAGLAVSSSAAAYHARFLRALVAKDAESKIGRAIRPSVSTSRASPVDDEDIHHPPLSAVSTTYPPIHPGHVPRHDRQSMHSSHSTSPQYPGFQGVPHASLPPAMQSTPQMSPTETKPVISPYRAPSIPTAPLSGGGPTPTYPHYNSAVDLSHSHAPHPPMVVQYPAVMQGTQSIPSELDMRYSHNLLSELGYPLMGIEPVAEWFTQAMGPSGCAGML
ncbi:hypothetical protein CPB86DRAFT_548759 [Serendipita vermifera]|nr:hypothetical protein CPB86DRAFT_548759 [Serendipita vermifera]